MNSCTDKKKIFKSPGCIFVIFKPVPANLLRRANDSRIELYFATAYACNEVADEILTSSKDA